MQFQGLMVKIICFVIGITSLLNTNLESRHWFDGVFLVLVDFVFIIWLLAQLHFAMRRRFGSNFSGSFDGDGDGGGDGGGGGGD